MLDEIPNIEVGKINVAPGSTIVMYTDGVVEQENLKQKQFGIEQLIKVVKSYSSLSMEDMNNIIFSKLDDWREESKYSDDTAILSCKIY